jgi:hypothetical protein
MGVQSILLDKSKFSRKKAIKWVKKHGFKPNTSTSNFETTNKFRFRQMAPRKTYRYRTKEITSGVELVLAYNKNTRKNRK